jgi:hypothetical protein
MGLFKTGYRVLLIVSLLMLATTVIPFSSLPVRAAEANGDFSLELKLNGQDALQQKKIVVDSKSPVKLDLYVYDVSSTAEINRISVIVFFAGMTIANFSQELNYVVNPGETYKPVLEPINLKDYVSVWGITVTTGRYLAIVQLDYSVSGQPRIWTQEKEIEIPGNPFTTMAGVVAAIFSGIASAAALTWLSSVLGYGAQLRSLDMRKTLESRARNNISKELVTAARKIVDRDKCPVCEGNIKYSYCRNCRKPARDIFRQYYKNVKEVSARGIALLSRGEIQNMSELPTSLGVSGRMAEDVIATIMNARLLAAKRVARKLAISAIITGISSGISLVLWVTVGGFVVVSTTTLVIILILSLVVPLIIVKIMLVRTRRLSGA